LIVTSLLVAGFLTTNLVSFGVSRAALKATILQNELPLTSSNIYSEIQADLLRPIFVSSLMSNDTFLRDWLLSGEVGTDKIIRYLEEIRIKYDAFTAFLISEKTKQYYHFSGPTKKVSEDDPRDSWFFRVRSMTKPYEVNIDYNQAQADATTIFINYRVLDYNGNFIGVTGIGLNFDTVARIISRYSDSFNRNVYFVDRSGKVMVRSNFAAVTEDNIRTAAGIREIADDILGKPDGFFEYQRNGETMLITTRLIRELDWHVVVEQYEADAIRSLWRGFYTNLVIGLLIIVVTVSAVAYTINLYQKGLEIMASTDKLTGLANRQTFDVSIEYALKSRPRNQRPVSVILLDIDHFKRINDTLGHLRGDAVIQKVAATVRETLRPADLPCRWGGEEIIALLEDCALPQALALAERIRAAVEALPMSETGPGIRVTVSAGVAQVRDGDDPDGVISRADHALYAAKDAGRNRVLAAP
jgi:diguanylate cyclase (GGDEF)-like protein